MVVVVAVGIMVDEAAMVAVDECIDQSLHLIRVAMVLICECLINLTRERKIYIIIFLYFYSGAVKVVFGFFLQLISSHKR